MAGFDTQPSILACKEYGDEDYVFLLYYQYVSIENPEHTTELHDCLCRELLLNGRVRISSEGINGTLGGTWRNMCEYIRCVCSEPCYGELNGSSIHWKISGCVDCYSLDRQKFQTLSVKSTKEVVSLNLSEEEAMRVASTECGEHLSPVDFHNALLSSPKEEFVLLDVRNNYETKIGYFAFENNVGEYCTAMDPDTRQFSEFSSYVDKQIGSGDVAVDKKVFMYCTGGVRCERASAYLKTKGIKEVYQLNGGIFNYMETFPDGGLFHGKNFVFDPRKALPYKNNNEIIGKCHICQAAYDDYAKQCRCFKCRVLLLVCDDCVLDAAGEPRTFYCTSCHETI